MADHYYAFTEQEFGFYTACQTDAAWILAMGVLETQSSTLRQVVETEIINVLPDVASRYFGYSGWCQHNEAGDSMSMNYIWGYAEIDGGVRPIQVWFL